MILESAEKSNKLMVSFFAFVMLLTFGIAIIIGFLNLLELYPNFTLWGTIVCSVLGLWVWCFANGNNPYLLTTSPDAASGGDTDRELKGNTNGFQE